MLVAIDDATFTDLGIQWPFPRSLHAKAIDALDRAGARKIVYDVQHDHFQYASGPLRSLAVTAATRTGGAALPRSSFDADGAWIDFRGPPGTVETVPFSSVIEGRADPALFRDRVVVVGASAPSL